MQFKDLKIKHTFRGEVESLMHALFVEGQVYVYDARTQTRGELSCRLSMVDIMEFTIDGKPVGVLDIDHPLLFGDPVTESIFKLGPTSVLGIDPTLLAMYIEPSK